jgi:minor extracellular serine protease Vpr
MKQFFSLLVLSIILAGPLVFSTKAQSGGLTGLFSRRVDGKLPEAVAGLRLPSPLLASGISLAQMRPGRSAAEGLRQVVIHLKNSPVGRLPAGQRATYETHRLAVEEEQAHFLNRALKIDPDMEVLGRVQLGLNAVLAEVDAAALAKISKDPAVLRISPVVDYELALSETGPYIGALPVHDQGIDGSGVRIAVLDTGVDYTHSNLFGPGTLEAYESAYGGAPSDPLNTTTDGLFPTDKVIGGFDFVGESWPSGPLAPDLDPIDLNGHGTHVADIIGGKKGVAPGVDLYAVKVCASLAGACSGVALIQAMEFAVNPNGDGDPKDHVDIINMSLGSNYGQPFDDNLSAAVDNATRLGVLTVAAAGNGSDRPYITATPGAGATAISVAQTQVPSAFQPTISVLEPADFKGGYQAAFQPWSAPLNRVIEGPEQYGDGAEGNLNGCTPFDEGSLEGRIVAVDRGDCFFSSKVRHIQEAGGVLGIIALLAPGVPFPGGFGEGSPITIPAYMVSKADGDILRNGKAVIRIAPQQGISLAGSVVDTSSRGPEFQSNHIKPELAAPVASVSAEAGTGTGESRFGGTSGATPMVSGAEALLIQGHVSDLNIAPEIAGLDRVARLTPLEVKARLMNTADVSIRNSADSSPAPISRIGGGEVRIDRALAAPVAAWDEDRLSGALSFGFVDVADETISLTKRVRLRNYSQEKLTYQVRSTHQFADDAATGAVTLSTPAAVSVDGDADTVFEVTLRIDGTKLRNNLMNSGSQGNDPVPLTTNEYDGYLTLDDGEQPIHLAWHVLPRKAARVVVDNTQQDPGSGPFTIKLTKSLELTNTGVGAAQNEAYSLLALSPPLPGGAWGQLSPTPDIRAIGVKSFEVAGASAHQAPHTSLPSP